MDALNGFAQVAPPLENIIPPEKARQALVEELEELSLTFEQSGLRDSLSVELSTWVGHFIHLLNNDAPIEPLMQRMASFAQQLLRNPMGGFWPFDREVYLGNDGHAYSKKALCVYLSLCEIESLQRSPAAPHSPTLFFLERPHGVAYAAQNWLEKHGFLLESPEIEENYKRLVDLERLVGLPLGRPAVAKESAEEEAAQALLRERNWQEILMVSDDEDEEIPDLDAFQEEILEAIARIDKEAEAAMQRNAEQINAFQKRMAEQYAEQDHAIDKLQEGIGELNEANQKVADRVHGLQEQMAQEGILGRQERWEARQFEREENLEQELRHYIAGMQDAVNQGGDVRAGMQRLYETIGERFQKYWEQLEQLEKRTQEQCKKIYEEILALPIEELERQIQELEEENGYIQEELQDLGKGIDNAKQRQQEIGLRLNNLKIMIKKKEQGFWKSALTSFAMMGLYLGVNLALASLCPGTALFPSSGGTPMLSYTFRF